MGRSSDGWRIACLDQVSSTNDVVRRAGDRGMAGRLAVFAELQTAGRGRSGRAWEVPAGLGLTGSTLWRPPVAADRVGTLAQVAGVAALRALAAQGVAARLKWPNDVLLGDAKCGGILIESAFAGDTVAYAVVGIGLNVLQSVDELPRTPYPATSVKLATGEAIDRVVLAAALLRAEAEVYERWLEMPQEVFAEWRGALSTLGRYVSLHAPDGERLGLAREVEPSGALVLELSDGSVERFLSAEVSGVFPAGRASGSRPSRHGPKPSASGR
jgi:BirA family biotin operon repressor/biotin-[acetyl-CoA-carboxylase] ligase